MRCLIALVALLITCGSCPAAEEKKPDDAAARERAAFDAAAKRLAEKQAAARAAATQTSQSEVERLRSEVAALREENAKLREELGIAEPGAANTPAATQPTQKVAFVVNAGGSMIQWFADAKEQAIRGVNNLNEGKSFALFVASDGGKVLSFGRGWNKGGPRAASAVNAFFGSVSTTGVTKLGPAVYDALLMRPDVLWIVVGDEVRDDPELTRAVAVGNRAGRTKINVALMVKDVDSLGGGLEGFLRRAVWPSGGVCITGDGKKIEPTSPAVGAGPVKGGKSIFDQ